LTAGLWRPHNLGLINTNHEPIGLSTDTFIDFYPQEVEQEVVQSQPDQDRKTDVEVILILPLGLDSRIYPWGVHLINDYLKISESKVKIRIFDLSRETYFAELHKHYGTLLEDLFGLLKNEPRAVFFGTTFNPYLFLNIVACVGDDFFRIVKNNNLVNSTLKFRRLEQVKGSSMRQLRRSFEAFMAAKINEFVDGGPETIRIWAFSVYDYTLFNSLHIASLIKRQDQQSAILLGGDYFDSQSAPEIVRAIPMVDGIVVGYGEEVMRKVLDGCRQGLTIKELRIPGLVNSINPNVSLSQGRRVPNVPPSYKDPSANRSLAYVKEMSPNQIHILTQRGCSWGRCTFCSQIDRTLYFPVDHAYLLQQISNLLDSMEKNNSQTSLVRLRCDADENDLSIIISLIESLKQFADRGLRFRLELWLRVSKFDKEFPRVLTENNQNVHVKVLLNIESLNSETLKNMQKGHSCLKALEAVKAMQDCGHATVVSNYFINYPLENIESVAEEVKLLKCALHLLLPPRVFLTGFPYAANSRDSIHENQKQYGVKGRRLEGDIWLREIFMVDLPFSIFAFTYKKELFFNLRDMIIYTYVRVVMAQRLMIISDMGPMVLGGKRERTLWQRLALCYRHSDYYLWRFLHLALQIVARSDAFNQRSQIFRYVKQVLRSKTIGRRSEEQASKTTLISLVARRLRSMVNSRSYWRTVSLAYFYLQGDKLIKEYNTPFLTENWSRRLDQQELQVLEYLYWRRKRQDLVERFKTDFSVSRLNEILEIHIGLGSVIYHQGWLFCVCNYPEYWSKTPLFHN
jgi:tRNA A37 methylthiotransferase MiaB